jgi:hypothetical protein
MRMPKSLFLLMTLFLTLGYVVSCSTTKLTAVWRDEGYQGHPRKVMVISVVNDPEIRQLVENEFITRFRARGVEAVAGYTILPDIAVVDKNVIVEKMKELGTDTVLIARHVDQRTARAEVPGTSWYGYYGVRSAGVVATDKYAVMQTKVYDLKTEQPIWSASSETWLTANVPERTIIQEFITAVIDQLARQRIIASGAGK